MDPSLGFYYKKYDFSLEGGFLISYDREVPLELRFKY